MAADFTPNLNPYSGQGSFRFWVQKVLPLVYDDSLTYYELLCRVVNFLNNVIQDMDTAEENIELIRDAYNQLQSYVNTYFDNLDIEHELDTIINRMIRDGRFENQVFEALKNNPVLLENPVHFELPGAVETQLPGVVAEQIGEAVSPLVPGAVTDWLDENVEPTTPVVDESLTISGAAADAKVVGDKFIEVDDLLFQKRTFNGNEIAWRYSSNTNSSNGNVVTNDGQKTYATSNTYLPLNDGSLHLKYTGPVTDENDVPYVISVCFYTDSGFISKVFMSGSGRPIDVPNNATRIKFTFGRATSSNVTCTSADTDMFGALEYFRTFEVDNTLSISGAAADASVTGSWVRNTPTMITAHCTSIPNNSDLNDYVTPGNYRVLNYSVAESLSNRPTSTPGRLFVFAINNTSQICQIYVPLEAYKYAYYTRTTSSGSAGFTKWNAVPIVKYHNPESTNDTNYIANALTNTGRCLLSAGTYYVSGIDMPENTEIIGEGNSTKIILIDSVETGYAIKMGNNCSVKNLTIVGSETTLEFTEGAADSIHIGNRHGILYLGTATEAAGGSANNTIKNGHISDCIIYGFTGGGITCENTGYGTNAGLSADNVTIRNCGAGINISYWCEFNKFTNVTCTVCYYGCINNAGNNLFSNCGFDSNIIGFYMNGVSGKCVKYDGSTATAKNNSHGALCNCTLNHNSHGDNAYAFYCRSQTSGFMVTNCWVMYGNMFVRANNWWSFTNCHFGHSDIEMANSNCSIMYNGCFFRDDVKAFIRKGTTNDNWVDANDFDTNGNLTTIKLLNCFYTMGNPCTALKLCQEAGIIS